MTPVTLDIANQAARVHVFFDTTQSGKTLLGDVDVVLVDAEGAILHMSTTTAAGVPAEHLAVLVTGHLRCIAGFGCGELATKVLHSGCPRIMFAEGEVLQ